MPEETTRVISREEALHIVNQQKAQREESHSIGVLSRAENSVVSPGLCSSSSVFEELADGNVVRSGNDGNVAVEGFDVASAVVDKQYRLGEVGEQSGDVRVYHDSVDFPVCPDRSFGMRTNVDSGEKNSGNPALNIGKAFPYNQALKLPRGISITTNETPVPPGRVSPETFDRLTNSERDPANSGRVSSSAVHSFDGLRLPRGLSLCRVQPEIRDADLYSVGIGCNSTSEKSEEVTDNMGQSSFLVNTADETSEADQTRSESIPGEQVFDGDADNDKKLHGLVLEGGKRGDDQDDNDTEDTKLHPHLSSFSKISVNDDVKNTLVLSKTESADDVKTVMMKSYLENAPDKSIAINDVKLPVGINISLSRCASDSTDIKCVSPKRQAETVSSEKQVRATSVNEKCSDLWSASAMNSESCSDETIDDNCATASAFDSIQLSGIKLPRGIHIESSSPGDCTSVNRHRESHSGIIISSTDERSEVKFMKSSSPPETETARSVAAAIADSRAPTTVTSAALMKPGPRSARLARLARLSPAEAASSLAAVSGFDDGLQSESDDDDNDEDDADEDDADDVEAQSGRSDCSDNILQSEQDDDIFFADEPNHEVPTERASTDEFDGAEYYHVSDCSASSRSVNITSKSMPTPTLSSAVQNTTRQPKTLTLQEARAMCSLGGDLALTAGGGKHSASPPRKERGPRPGLVASPATLPTSSNVRSSSGERNLSEETGVDSGYTMEYVSCQSVLSNQSYSPSPNLSNRVDDDDSKHTSREFSTSADNTECAMNNSIEKFPPLDQTDSSPGAHSVSSPGQAADTECVQEAASGGKLDEVNEVDNVMDEEHSIPDEISCLIGGLGMEGTTDTASANMVQPTSLDGTAEDLSEVKDMLDILDEKPELLAAVSTADDEDGEDVEEELDQSDDSSNSAGSDSDAEEENATEVKKRPLSPSNDADAESDLNEPVVQSEGKSRRRRRKRRRRDKGKCKEATAECKSDDEAAPKKKRRNIRQIISEEKLDSETVKAQEEEKERQQRLAEQKRWYEQFRRQQEREQLEKRRRIAAEEQSSVGQTEVAKSSDVITLSSDEENTTSASRQSIKKELMLDQDSAVCPDSSTAAVTPAVVTAADSSDDDIQLLSSADEEPTTPEDVNNAGAHTDDTCNVADSSGRVLVNVGHPPSERDIFLAPQIARNIKPHQIGGVRFLYDNLIESLDRCKNTPGFGCILAHSMGLGKTMQTVTFTDLFLRYTVHRLVLIIVPINTIQNWVNEFNYWLPPENCYTPLALCSQQPPAGEPSPPPPPPPTVNPAGENTNNGGYCNNGGMVNGAVNNACYGGVMGGNFSAGNAGFAGFGGGIGAGFNMGAAAAYNACFSGYGVSGSAEGIFGGVGGNNGAYYMNNGAGMPTGNCGVNMPPITASTYSSSVTPNGMTMTGCEIPCYPGNAAGNTGGNVLPGHYQMLSGMHMNTQGTFAGNGQHNLSFPGVQSMNASVGSFDGASGGVSSGAMPSGGVSGGAMPSGGVSGGAMPSGGVSSGAMPSGGVSSGAMPSGGVSSGASGSGGSADNMVDSNKDVCAQTDCDKAVSDNNKINGDCKNSDDTEKKDDSEFSCPTAEDDEGDPVTGVRHRSFPVLVLSELHRTIQARAKVIQEWSKNGGVLLMGYEMYRALSLNSQRSGARKKKKRSGADDVYTEEREKLLSENIKSALCKPGPDLVICDEGHRIKNAGASISQALKSIRTRRRLALTGYPLQNNLVEYWCMVDFVRPNFLGNKAEFNNMFERPISNGQCSDSTPADVRLMRFRAHVLHSLLEGLVQRRSQAILEAELPKKEEYVCMLRMTAVQRNLYKQFIVDLLSRPGHTPNPLRAFVVSCKIWNHPDILYNLVRRKLVDVDLELEVSNTDGSTVGKSRRSAARSGGGNDGGNSTGMVTPTNPAVSGDPSVDGGNMPPHSGDTQTPVSSSSQPGDTEPPAAPPVERPTKEDNAISYDWAQELLQNYVPGLMETSSKMLVFNVILRESVLLGDKMLLFSQSLFTLNIIEEFLQQQLIPGRLEKWAPNKSYFRLDGSTSGLERERLIHNFNTSGDNVPLFLVSTRAGSLGVNLVGANRVLVFDASWNPCHDTQAVCRVYRFGQQKQCYVYRLVTDNSMERRIYDRQVKKQSMSNRIVDETNPENMVSAANLNRLLDPEDDDPPESEVSIDGNNYSDPVLRQVLHQHGRLFTKAPFEHDAQLVDRQDKRLTQAEKRLAKRGYELEKKASASGGASRAGGARQTVSAVGMYRGMYNKPVANVRPMMSGGRVMGRGVGGMSQHLSTSRYSAEQLARQGVTMTHINVPKDVSIPTGSGQGEPIFLRRGQTVLVIKTAKGVYLRLQDGRIIAIRVPPGSDSSSTGVPHFLGGGSTPTTTQENRASGGSSSVSIVGSQSSTGGGGDVIRLPRSITVERVPADGEASSGTGGGIRPAPAASWARRGTGPAGRLMRPVRHITVGRGVKRMVVPSRAGAAAAVAAASASGKPISGAAQRSANSRVVRQTPASPQSTLTPPAAGSHRVKVLVKPSGSAGSAPTSVSMTALSNKLSAPRGKVHLEKSAAVKNSEEAAVTSSSASTPVSAPSTSSGTIITTAATSSSSTESMQQFSMSTSAALKTSDLPETSGQQQQQLQEQHSQAYRPTVSCSSGSDLSVHSKPAVSAASTQLELNSVTDNAAPEYSSVLPTASQHPSRSLVSQLWASAGMTPPSSVSSETTQQQPFDGSSTVASTALSGMSNWPNSFSTSSSYKPNNQYSQQQAPVFAGQHLSTGASAASQSNQHQPAVSTVGHPSSIDYRRSSSENKFPPAAHGSQLNQQLDKQQLQQLAANWPAVSSSAASIQHGLFDHLFAGQTAGNAAANMLASSAMSNPVSSQYSADLASMSAAHQPAVSHVTSGAAVVSSRDGGGPLGAANFDWTSDSPWKTALSAAVSSYGSSFAAPDTTPVESVRPQSLSSSRPLHHQFSSPTQHSQHRQRVSSQGSLPSSRRDQVAHQQHQKQLPSFAHQTPSLSSSSSSSSSAANLPAFQSAAHNLLTAASNPGAGVADSYGGWNLSAGPRYDYPRDSAATYGSPISAALSHQFPLAAAAAAAASGQYSPYAGVPTQMSPYLGYRPATASYPSPLGNDQYAALTAGYAGPSFTSAGQLTAPSASTPSVNTLSSQQQQQQLLFAGGLFGGNSVGSNLGLPPFPQ